MIRSLEQVQADELAAIATDLLAPGRLSAAGIGPDEDVFLAGIDRINPALRHVA